MVRSRPAASVLVFAAALAGCRGSGCGGADADRAEGAHGCAEWSRAAGPRRLGFSLPGDPASHPGCTLRETGDLQCPEDFDGWNPKSKVKVPEAEARALLDEVEKGAATARCAPCPRNHRPAQYAPGYDPESYPARLCRTAACVETCGTAKSKLLELRVKYASTQTATTENLDRD